MGCASPPTAPRGGRPAPPTATVVVADWNDLDASVTAAVARVEMAVLSKESSDPHVRRYALRTATDRPATLTASRRERGEGESIPITLTASIGIEGDDAYQRALLDVLTRRLRQLHGRDAAPLNW